MQNQPQVLTIKMVVPGVELVLQALSKLPYEQSAGLIAEIQGQAQYQLQEAQKAQTGTSAPAEVEVDPVADAEAAAEAPVGGTD
jgi:hypothetical protein